MTWNLFLLVLCVCFMTACGGVGAQQGPWSSGPGVQVLVGRNNKQNDELTNRVAKAADVWMHARGCPGAHVLLRASTTNRFAL